MPTRRILLRLLVPAVAVLAAAHAASGADARSLHVVFPEGFSIRQMTDRVAEVRGIAIRRRHVTPRLTGRAYSKAAAQARAPRGFPRRPRRIEGFLFPATYEFTATSTAAELVSMQRAAFERAWSTVDLGVARARGRTAYDVLTIASMVERETVAPKERALVAAAIYNRLDKGMPLGIDATLRYGPANVDYLYYVRKPDHVHHFFTADEQEFCRKAAEYGYSC